MLMGVYSVVRLLMPFSMSFALSRSVMSKPERSRVEIFVHPLNSSPM